MREPQHFPEKKDQDEDARLSLKIFGFPRKLAFLSNSIRNMLICIPYKELNVSLSNC